MTATPSQRQLTAPEVDLATLAASKQIDGYLVELAGLANVGIGTVLGLVVDGTIIVGRLAPETQMAEVMDEHIQSILAIAEREAESPADKQFLAEQVTNPHQKAAEERQNARTRVRELVEAEIGDADIELTGLAENLARALVNEHAQPALTLAEAHVFPHGAKAPISIPALRVIIHQIGAWWIVPTDPSTGRADFSYPS
jgi:hypothetical protein